MISLSKWRAELLLAAVVLSTVAASLVTDRARSSAAHTYDAIRQTAEELGLFVASDPVNRNSGDRSVLLSESPIPRDWQVRYNIHRSGVEQWRGTVIVYAGQQLRPLSDGLEHPEMCDVWAGSFVYGDPDLIARLKAVK